MINPTKETYEFVRSLCYYSGEPEEFVSDFWNRLTVKEAVYEELETYRLTGNFPCNVNVNGVTIVDIMIWQIDHFKAFMDRGLYDMKENGDKMVLMAFDTMLKMLDEPEKYLEKFQGETGTDYVDKF